MKKRLLSVFLSFCMMLTLLPATALAAEEPTPLEEAQAAQQALKAALEDRNVTWSVLYDATLSYNALDNETDKSDLTEYYARIDSLDLSGQSIEAVYGFTDVGVLAPFTGLKTLDISNTGVTDIGGLNGMTSLGSLNVSTNSKIDDLGALANKPIKDLNLSGTDIDSNDFGALTTLPLVSLDLSDTQITSIGPLTTNGSNPACANTLEDLNISNTQVTQLQEVWDRTQSKPSLPKLKTLTAQGLKLTSISGLVEIVNKEDFDPTGISWNISGSTLVDETNGTSHIQQIMTKFGNSGSFVAPNQEGGMPVSVSSAQNWMNKFKADLGEDGGKEKLTWDTLITAVYWYETATDEVSRLTEGDVKTACKETLSAIKANFENVETLDMSDKDSSQYAISTGALVHFTGLKHLNLSGTGIIEAGGLEKLTSLESLDLSGNKGIDNTSFGALVSMSSLKELNLSGTSITDIGGLTGTENNGVEDTLETLDISNTGVTKLESIWGAEEATAPAFSALKKLTAKNLALESISGLARIAEQVSFSASEYTWDLTGSTLTGTASNGDNLAAIQAAFENNSNNFNMPTYEASVAEDLTNALTALSELNTELESDDKASWDTLITAVYYYQQAQNYVNGLTEGEDKTAAAAALKEITDGFADITVLDMSNQSTSQYAISTGALVPFTGLTELNLSNTGISETGGLVGLTKLEKLNLSGNKGINNTHFGALANMSVLKELNLNGTGITDIGGLTGSDGSGVADTLATLDISGTDVIKLESVWNGTTSAFPQLKNLVAKNLSLDSISGLVEIVNQEGFSVEGISWDLTDSTLPETNSHGDDNQNHINIIATKLNGQFIPPTVETEEPEPETVPVTGVTLDKAAASIKVDGTVTLTATITPASATNKNVTWSSSNNSIATVNANGVVTGEAAGTATITVTTVDGNHTATCVVTVTTSGSTGGGGGTSGGSSFSGYTITVEDTDHGSIRVSPSRASKGDTVTITVDPDTGYELDTLIVRDSNGDRIDVERQSDTRYTFEMPSRRVTVEVTFVEITEEPVPSGLPFTDVHTGDYYYDAVAWAVENGVTSGTSATTFSPNNACTRAQIVTFLWRAAGSPEPEATVNPFTDVSTSAYYYDAVLWAVDRGITNGTSATTFSPDATVTRGQTVTFLWRYAGSPTTGTGSFTDVAADAYYATAVAWAAAEGVTSGTSATTFSPDAACTRAQIVTFLYRYLG